MDEVNQQACLDVVKKYIKTLPNITTIDNFKHDLIDFIENEKNQFRENNNIPTSEDICDLVKNKESMKNVIDALKQIENKLDREFAGLDIIEVENFRSQYTRKEKKQFLKVIDRDDIDINYLEPSSTLSEKDICNLVKNKDALKYTCKNLFRCKTSSFSIAKTSMLSSPCHAATKICFNFLSFNKLYSYR